MSSTDIKPTEVIELTENEGKCSQEGEKCPREQVEDEQQGLTNEKQSLTEEKTGLADVDRQDKEVTVEVDDTDYGCFKWVVVFACFFQHVIIGGFERSDGVLYIKLINRFQQSAQATAWVGALSSTIRLVLGPLSSAFSNKFSSRTSVITGGIIMSIGILTSGFASSLLFLYLTYGVIGGIGRSLVYAPGLITVGQYFSMRPGLAVGLSSSGVGAGTFVIPPLMDLLFEEFNFMGAFLILSGICLNVCVSGAIFRPLEVHKKIMFRYRRRKSRAALPPESTVVETETDILIHDRSETSKDLTEVKSRSKDIEVVHVTPSTPDHPGDAFTSKDNFKRRFSCWTNFCKMELCKKSQSSESKKKLLEFSLLKNPPFLMFCLSICLFTAASKSALTFVPALSKSRGCSETEAALLMSVVGVVDTISRILAGILLDLKRIRKFRPFIYNSITAIVAVISFIYPSLNSFTEFALVGAVYGAFIGAYISQKSVVLVDILGVEKLPSSFGLLILFQGIGTLIGPPLSGLLKDVFGDYTEAFYFGGSSMMVASLVMVLSNILLVRQRRSSRASKDV